MSSVHPPHRFSLCTLQLKIYAGGPESIADATGLWLKSRRKCFIVTNWHVVTGKHPKTGVLKSLAPQSIQIAHRCECPGQPQLGIKWVEEPLYSQDGRRRWIEHDTRNLSALEDPNLAIDVVLLPLTKTEGCLDYLAFPSESPYYPPFLDVESPVSIVGYPSRQQKGAVTGVVNFPIWKHAFVASDIDAHPDQKHFLVDCVTRKGMSGSPVFASEQLIGLYSGRVLDDEEFGIGIVWRTHLISELLAKYFSTLS